MKKLIPLLMAAGLILSCTGQKEIQMSMTDVKLIRIDTIQRYDESHQILTWRTDDHIDYVTYEPMTRSFSIGSRMKVLVKR